MHPVKMCNMAIAHLCMAHNKAQGIASKRCTGNLSGGELCTEIKMIACANLETQMSDAQTAFQLLDFLTKFKIRKILRCI